jgi:hypothetical protein
MAAFWPPRMLTQEQAVEIKVLARRDVGPRSGQSVARNWPLLTSAQ